MCIGGGGGSIGDNWMAKDAADAAATASAARQAEIEALRQKSSDDAVAKLNDATEGAKTAQQQAMDQIAASQARASAAPTVDAAEVKAASDAEKQRAIKARGRAATVLTSGQGALGGATTLQPAAKALLG